MLFNKDKMGHIKQQANRKAQNHGKTKLSICKNKKQLEGEIRHLTFLTKIELRKSSLSCGA